MLSSQGDLVDSYDPALKEHRTVCFLAFDGHCYMYRAVKRVLKRAARVLYRGEARQTLPPIQEWRRFDAADVQPGLFWCEDLRDRRREPQGGHQQPGAVLRAEAEAGHQDPRAAGGAQGAAAEVVRALNQEYRGQRLAGLAHKIFLKLLKAPHALAQERLHLCPGVPVARALC